MFRKLALAIAGAPFLLSAAPDPLAVAPKLTHDRASPSPFRGSFETVPLIECQGSRGSGVRVSDNIVITAAHVTSSGPCGIDGFAAELVHRGAGGLDFTALRVELPPGLEAIVSCEGIIPGQRYYAYGYAFGGKANVEPLIGTNARLANKGAIMRGRVFPGMSGGMVANEEGAFVATTIQYNDTVDAAVVIPLTETFLCAG